MARQKSYISPLAAKYNVQITPGMPDWQIELLCWARRDVVTAYPKFHHFKEAFKLMWPEAVWHPWRERRFEAFCNPKYFAENGGRIVRVFSWMGCGAAGKTHDAMYLALAWWLADPYNSIVTLTSTTKDSARRRMWSVLQSAFYEFRDLHRYDTPYVINSSMILEAEKGENKHAIYTQAIEAGELTKCIANIQGRHAPRMLLVVDEAMGTPEAVFAAIPNVFKGATEVNLLFISNAPLSRLNPFMKLACPVDGWERVSPDHTEWQSRDVPAWQIPNGWCLHFSGKESPNVLAGKNVYPFLYRVEDWMKVEGNSEISKTPQFWSQDLGFPPPEGALFQVMTESLIEARDGRGHHTFRSWAEPIAGLDPSWGNDECKLVFGVMGDIDSVFNGIQISENMVVHIDVEARDEKGKRIPPEYQIASKVVAECTARGVKPDHIGIMAGGNPGVIGVLENDWGEIFRVEESGAPSDAPASAADMRPSNEVYDRRVTELYFLVRSLVEGSQLKGLYENAIEQLCSRLLDAKRVERSRRKAIEQKEVFKPRFGRSPDDAEAIIAMCAVARQHGVEPQGINFAKRQELDIHSLEEDTVATVNDYISNDTTQNSPFAVDFRDQDELPAGWIDISDDGRSGFVRRYGDL